MIIDNEPRDQAAHAEDVLDHLDPSSRQLARTFDISMFRQKLVYVARGETSLDQTAVDRASLGVRLGRHRALVVFRPVQIGAVRVSVGGDNLITGCDQLETHLLEVTLRAADDRFRRVVPAVAGSIGQDAGIGMHAGDFHV